MSRSITYYFSMVSPWAYIGHEEFHAIAHRHYAEIHYRPVPLPQLFSKTGGLPLAQRPITRQNYRWLELQRWREKRGLSFKLKPEFWPFQADLADRVIIALCENHRAPATFMINAFNALWSKDKDLSNEATLRNLLNESQEQGDEIIEKAQSDPIAKLYDTYLREAEFTGVFGSPSYILNGELFWGQDRLDLLDDALACGREAYTLPE